MMKFFGGNAEEKPAAAVTAEEMGDVEKMEDATWGEVFTACCVHDAAGYAKVLGGISLVLFFLYFFLLGLDLLGGAAKVIGGCAAGSLLSDDTNPIGGLMIGILATVLLQSSSTTTSIIVSLVGADAIATKVAIYMVMGANIGTSVTNTIVAMGQMGDGDQLERAFSGATVHDLFNFMTVGVLLPVEAATGYLYYLSKAIVSGITFRDGEKWVGPLKKIVGPLTAKIIKANKDVIKDIATGKKENCDSYYPTSCINGTISKATCSVGLIACDKATGKCPAFFTDGATQKEDEVAGGVALFLGLLLLCTCLLGMVWVLQKMLMNTSSRIIYKATNINPYIAIVVGILITILVQSSSVTTSALTPLVGMDVIQLEQMLPLTLGANIGTTVTALLAALVSDKIDSLQVAFCHLFFNITGILLWFPIPFLRNIPMTAARKLGKATRTLRIFPLIYILTVFFAIPLAFFGISELFEQENPAYTTLGSFIVIILFLNIVYVIYWIRMKDGATKTVDYLVSRQKKVEAVKNLPDDMEALKADIAALKAHTNMA